MNSFGAKFQRSWLNRYIKSCLGVCACIGQQKMLMIVSLTCLSQEQARFLYSFNKLSQEYVIN